MEAMISNKVASSKSDELRKLFNSMLKGSNSAKYLSLIYSLVSFILVFNYRNELAICIPLVLSGITTLVFALKYLWLRGVKPTTDTVEELIDKVKVYKTQTLKREKYEQFVIVFWILTLVPWFLDGKEITTFTVIRMLVIFYIFILMGNWAFAKVKNQLKEMGNLIDEINLSKS